MLTITDSNGNKKRVPTTISNPEWVSVKKSVKKDYPFAKEFCSHKNSDKIIGGKRVILHSVCCDCGVDLTV